MSGVAAQSISSLSLLGLAAQAGVGLSPQSVAENSIVFGGMDEDVVVEPLIKLDGEPVDHDRIGGYGAMENGHSPRTVVDRYNGILDTNLGKLISGRLCPATDLTESQQANQSRLLAGWLVNEKEHAPPVSRFDSMTLRELLSRMAVNYVPGTHELADWLALKGRNLNLSEAGFRETVFSSAAVFVGLKSPGSSLVAEMLLERIAVDYERFEQRKFGDATAEDAIMFEMSAVLRDVRNDRANIENTLRPMAARAWMASIDTSGDLATTLFKMIRAMKNAWLGADVHTLFDAYRRYAESTYKVKSIMESAKDKVRVAWARQLVHEINPDTNRVEYAEALKAVTVPLSQAAEVLPEVREFMESLEVE